MGVPPPMGSAKAINFQPTDGGKAPITGDFVLIAKEVNPVLRVLRDHGIEVTAIHNHMLDDQYVSPAELQRDQMIQFANVILAGVIGWVSGGIKHKSAPFPLALWRHRERIW